MLTQIQRARLARDLTAKVQELEAITSQGPGGGVAQAMTATRLATGILDAVGDPMQRVKLASQLAAKVAELVAAPAPGAAGGPMAMMQRARLAKEVNELHIQLGGASISNEHVQVLSDIAAGRKNDRPLDVLWSLIYQAVESLMESGALSGQTETLANDAITRWAELEEQANV